MLNNYFRNNWNKILSYNSKISLMEKPEDLLMQVRIPLTPIIVEGYLIHYLFGLLYPKFINDQQNILDIIISDHEIENRVLKVYLYITKKAGIHETIEALSKDLLKINQTNLENKEDLYNKIQVLLLEKKKIKVASIRIFKKRGIDLIDTYCRNLERNTTLDYIPALLDLIQKLIQEELIYLLPEPNILQFFRGFFKLFNNFKISTFFRLFKKYSPDFITTLIFHSKNLDFLSVINKSSLKLNKPDISIKLKTIKELNLELADFLSKERLQSIQKTCNSDSIFSFSQNDIIAFLLDLFDLSFPIKKENMKLILQKFIFGIRSYEIHWNLLPRPKIYNILIRFLIRLLGININFKKLSHWAIPDLLFNIFDTYFGLNSDILIVLTDRNIVISKTSLVLEIKNSSIKKVIPIDNSDIISDNKIESLEMLKYKIVERHGFNPVIMKIDIILIQKIMAVFLFKFYKIKPLSVLSMVKMIKKEDFFQIYPELPPYQLIKKKGAFTILKLLLSLIIDKHEF